MSSKQKGRGSVGVDDIRVVLRAMRETFAECDLDGDGDITCDEFRQVLEEMVGEPCPEDDWNELIPKIDSDNSGTVSFSEFLHALYHWFAEDEASTEPDEEQDETDYAFAYLKELYTQAREAEKGGDRKFLSRQTLATVWRKLSPTDATPDNLDKTFAHVERQSEVKDKNKFNFKDFLFGTYVFLVPQDDNSGSDEGGDGYQSS